MYTFRLNPTLTVSVYRINCVVERETATSQASENATSTVAPSSPFSSTTSCWFFQGDRSSYCWPVGTPQTWPISPTRSSGQPFRQPRRLAPFGPGSVGFHARHSPAGRSSGASQDVPSSPSSSLLLPDRYVDALAYLSAQLVADQTMVHPAGHECIY